VAEQNDNWQPMWYRLARAAALLGAGLYGLFYEVTIHSGEPRMRLVVLYSYMMGLPLTMYRDRKAKL
jgi:hypothetical protein